MTLNLRQSYQVLDAAQEAYSKRNDKFQDMDNKTLGRKVGNAIINLKNHAIFTEVEGIPHWFGNETNVIYSIGTQYEFKKLYAFPDDMTDFDALPTFKILCGLTYNKCELMGLKDMTYDGFEGRVLYYRMLIGTPELDLPHIKNLLERDLIIERVRPIPILPAAVVNYDERDDIDSRTWNEVYENALYSVRSQIYKLYESRGIFNTEENGNPPPYAAIYERKLTQKTFFEGMLFNHAIDLVIGKLTYSEMIECFFDLTKAFCQGFVTINVVDNSSASCDDPLTESMYVIANNFYRLRQIGASDVFRYNNGSVVNMTNTNFIDEDEDDTRDLVPTKLFISALVNTPARSRLIPTQALLFLSQCIIHDNKELYKFAFAVFETLAYAG